MRWLRRLVVTRLVAMASIKWEPALTADPQTILDCSETNEGFYVKCGYKRAGLEMAHYYGKK